MTVTVANQQRRQRIPTERLRQLAASFPTRLESLSIAFVSDAVMSQVNGRYHGVAGPTDILTFDYGAGVGELIISADCAARQARQFRVPLPRELARYVIHGLLHLHGLDDQTPAQRRRMRRAERRWLARWERAGLGPRRAGKMRTR
jgi:rRNA maturation RNase YbeY